MGHIAQISGTEPSSVTLYKSWFLPLEVEAFAFYDVLLHYRIRYLLNIFIEIIGT